MAHENAGPFTDKHTLLQYKTPVIVSKRPEKTQLPTKVPEICLEEVVPEGDKEILTEDTLNFIFPPKEWEEKGKRWKQTVSSNPATKADVWKLQEDLDTRLQQQSAGETGICPLRRRLYRQLLDELIRQETVNCVERGLLLMRVRDEAEMTIATYQTLYESATAFGIRKALKSEEEKMNMEVSLANLKEIYVNYGTQSDDLKTGVELLQKHAVEQREADEKKHIEEVNALKKLNFQYKGQLEKILYPKKT